MEELILVILILLTLSIIYSLYRLYKEKGLTYLVIILSLISYVLSLKISIIFNSNVNIGIIPLLGCFVSLYICILKCDKKEVYNIIKTTFIANITLGIFLIVLNHFVPSITDTYSMNLTELLNDNFKTIILYPLVVVISQYSIYRLFNMLMNIKTNCYLAVILTYIITSIIYTVIFNLIAYINILSLKNSLFLGISTYILGLIITLIEALFIYVITKKKVNHE